MATSGIDYDVKLWEPMAAEPCCLTDLDEVLYSWTFSLVKIFTDFADRSQSVKILTTKILMSASRLGLH